MLRLLAALLTFLPALALADITGPARVIDGDTLEIEGQRIRLHGIDAPETDQPCRLNGERWRCGQDAADALAEKIGRQPVTCHELDRGPYGRSVATCTVDGEDIGEWLVSSGWAVAYCPLGQARRLRRAGHGPQQGAPVGTAIRSARSAGSARRSSSAHSTGERHPLPTGRAWHCARKRISACLRVGLLDDVMFVRILGEIPVSSVDDYGHNF